MMQITVVSQSNFQPTGFEGMALMQDAWNDFSFMTQYHLYLATPAFTGRIGEVKILRRGQTKADGQQLQTGPIGPLGPDFVSLGQGLDYYERLASLPEPLKMEILDALRDALAHPDQAAGFLAEEGWRTSVLRYIDWDTFRIDAAVLLERDYDRVARLGLEVSFQVTGWADPFALSFAAPSPLWPGDNTLLPDRIAVLVGRNGAGKSTLISRLARVLHASQKDRSSDAFQALGRITPPGIGFTRVVNLAYSAFDVFILPGRGNSEQKQILDDMERGAGRYHYCGLRNLRFEILQSQGVGDVDGNPIQAIDLDRQERIILKTSQALADEFGTTIGVILESNRHELFSQVCRILASDASFSDLGPNPAGPIFQTPVALFQTWSTGHKIVMHAAASLVAFTEPKSIVLFDEPESHLHPPLLAALMHAMRLVLTKNDAFAVVATHSPVVVQETLGQHIAVIRRAGEARIRPPAIETYGESLGEITNEVFGLGAEATDFHKTLAALVERGLSLEHIERLFRTGMSLQARAFVMTLLAGKQT